MHRIACSLLLIVLLVLGLCLPSLAYDSRLVWRTLETEHFYVHFHDGERELALRAAILAEQVFDMLSEQLDWQPWGKVQLVIADDSDRANGWASTIPYNTVRLYATAPTSDQRIDEYGDWFHGLLMHEMTHVLHIDQARGFNRLFRAIFGRVYAVNGIHPILQIEGLAVLKETSNTEHGRGRSSLTQMYLRAAILEDRFPSIDQSTTFFLRWPGSAVPYLFGGAFHVYVADNYGENCWTQISKRHSRQVWPFLYNSNAERVIGKSLVTLWREWQTVLRSRFERQAAQIRSQGLYRGERVTFSGYQTRKPTFAGPRSLYFQQRTPRRKNRIMLLDLQTSRTSKVALIDGPGGMDALGNDLLVYSDDRVYQIDYLFKDLFLIDRRPRSERITSGKRQRLTRGARLLDPAFFSDGKRVLAVQNRLQSKDLVIYDLETRSIERVSDLSPELVQFDRPDVHTDGRRAAVAAWHERGERDIYLYDLEDHVFTRLTSHPAKEIDPQFTPDGELLLFSSDRSGVYNIYALDLPKQRLFQLTNVLGGAFWPSVSSDGELLAYTGYTADGFDVFVLELDKAWWREVPYEPPAPSGPPRNGNPIDLQAAAEQFPEHKYSPWRTIWPRYWLPELGTTADETLFGITTSGRDVLQYHSYSATALYGPQSEFLSYWLSYANRQLWPTIRLNQAAFADSYGKLIRLPDGRRRQYFERRITGSVGAYAPIVEHLVAGASYRIQQRDNITRIPSDAINPPNTGLFSGLALSLSFNNTQSYGRSISPERGVDLGLGFNWWADWLGSDYDLRIISASARAYQGLWLNHALALRLVGGLAQGDVLRQRTFRLGGFGGSGAFAVPSEGSYFMRGFGASQFKGQRIVAGSVEYRLPIWWIDRGISTWPIYFKVLHANLFYDTGQSFDRLDFKPRDLHQGLGAEIKLDTRLAYGMAVNFRFALAQGLGDEGDLRYMYYLGGLF
ncbi:MAG: hypothetical protein P9M14_06820 [Candidatus Alcyoniella australis]|nr:hypothetical protein [Candidatus Alcyoniella australis]